MVADWLLLALTYLWAAFCVSLGVYALIQMTSQSETTWSSLSCRKPSQRYLARAPMTCMANRQVDEESSRPVATRQPAALTSSPESVAYV